MLCSPINASTERKKSKKKMSQEYEEKIQELQKFVPVLNKRIEDIRKKNDGVVGDQWEKMRNILNKKIIVSMDILVKTAAVLKKLEKDSNSPKRQIDGSMRSDRRSSQENKFVEASNVENDAKPELQIKEVKKEPNISNVCDEDNVQILSIPKSNTGEVIIIDDNSDDDQPSSKQTMETDEKPSPTSNEIPKVENDIASPTCHQSVSETPQCSKRDSFTTKNLIQKETKTILNPEKMAENQEKSREILSSLEKQLMALTSAAALPLTIDDIVTERSSSISSVEQYLSTCRNDAEEKSKSSASAAEMNDKKLSANIGLESTNKAREISTAIKLPFPLPSFNEPNEIPPLPFKIDKHQTAASQKPETGELTSESVSENTSEQSTRNGPESSCQESIDSNSNYPSKINNRLGDIIATPQRSLTKPSDRKSENVDSPSMSGSLQIPSTDNAAENSLCNEATKTIAADDVGNYVNITELPALVQDMLNDVSSSNENDTENLVIDETTPIVTSEKPSESGNFEKVDRIESNIPEERVECEKSDANERELLYKGLGDDTATMEELRMSDDSDITEQEEKNENDFEGISSEESKSPKNTSNITISPTKLAGIPSDQTKDVTLSPTSVNDSNLASDRGAETCTKSEFVKDEADEPAQNARDGKDIISIPSTESIVDAEINEVSHTASVAGTTPQSKIDAHTTETLSESSPAPTESSLPQEDTGTSTTQFSPSSRKSIEERAIPLPNSPTSESESASKTIFQLQRDEKFPSQNTSNKTIEELSRKKAEIKRELEDLKPEDTDSNESERLGEPRIRKNPSKNVKDISDELNDLSDCDADYLSLYLSEISDVESGELYSDKEKQEDDTNVEDAITLEDESSSNVISRRVKFLNQGATSELDVDNLQVIMPVSDLRTYLNTIKKDNVAEVDKSFVEKKKKRQKKHLKRDCLPEEKVVMQFKTGRPYRHSSIRSYGANGRSKLSDCKNLDNDDLKLLKHHASLKRSPRDDLDEEDIKFSTYQQVPSDTESVSSSDEINAVNISPKRENDGYKSRGSRDSRSPQHRAPNPYAGASKQSSQLDELNSVSPRALGRPRSGSISPQRLKISTKRRSKTPERISRRSKRSPSPRSSRRLSKSPKSKSPTRSPKLRRSRTRSPKPKLSLTRSPKPRRSRTRSPKPKRRSLSPKRSRSPDQSRFVRRSRSPRPRRQSLSPKRSRSPGRPRLPRRSRSPKPSRRPLSSRRSRSPRRLRSPRRSRSPRLLRSPRKTKSTTSKQQISPRSLRLRRSRSPEKIARSSSHLSPSRSPPHSIRSSHRSVNSIKRSPTHHWSNHSPKFVDTKNDDPSYYSKNFKSYRHSSIEIDENAEQFQIEKPFSSEKSSPDIDKEELNVPVIDLIELDDDDEKDETYKIQNQKQNDNDLPSVTIEVSDDEEETLQAPPPPIISVQTHSKEIKKKAIEKDDTTITSETNANDSSLIILIDDEAEPKKSDGRSSAIRQSEAVKIENDPVGDKDTSVSEPSKANPNNPPTSERPVEASTETWATKDLNELHEIRIKLEQESGISFQDLLSQMISSEFSKETGYPSVDCAAEFSANSTDQSSEFTDRPMVMIPQIDPVPQQIRQRPVLANISPNDPRLNRFMPKAIPTSPLIRDTAPPPPLMPRLTPAVALPTSSKAVNVSKELLDAESDYLTGSESDGSDDSYSKKDDDDYVKRSELGEIIRQQIENIIAANKDLLAKSYNTKETATAEKKSPDKPKSKKNVSKPVNVEKIVSNVESSIADLVKRRSRNAATPLEKQAKGKVQRARVNRIVSSSDSEIDNPMDKSFEPKEGSLRERFTSEVNEFHELGKKSKKSKSKKAKQAEAATAPVQQPTDVPEVNLLTPLKEIPYAEKRKRKPEAGTSKRRRRHQIPKNIDITKHWNYSGKENCLVCKEKHDDVVYHYVNEHRENEVFCARLQQEQVEALKAKPNMVCLIKNANIEKYCGKCVFCSEGMNYPIGRYMEHVASHTGEFAYECNICGWRWAAKKDIFDHFKNECKKGAKFVYVYRYDLSDKMIEAYYCTICNYTQLNTANVVKHIRTEHDKQLVTSADYASLTIFKVGESREIDDIVVSNEAIAEANEPDEYMEEIPVSPSDDRVMENSPDDMDYVKDEMDDAIDELWQNIQDDLKEPMKSPEAANSVEIEAKPISPLELMETELPAVIDMPSEQNSNQVGARLDVFTEIPAENLQKMVEKTPNATPSRKISLTISYPTVAATETEMIIDMPPEHEYIAKEELLAALEEPVAPPPPPVKSEKPPMKPSPKVLALSNTNIKRVKHVGFEKISANDLKFYCLIETCEFLTADSVEDLREHMKKHTRKWNLACNMCKNSNTEKKKSATIDKEITHLISEHLPSYVTVLLRPWLKESQSLKSKESCVMLMQHFHLENLYKCMASNCVYTTTSSREMQFHVNLTHGNDLTALNCCYCDESFIHSNGLVDHIGKAHGSSIYQCAHCFYRSCAAYSVQVHQRNFHKDKKNPKILVCSGMSYTFSTEILEILDNCKMNIKPSKCPFCRKWVYVKHLLMDHIRKEHPHEKAVEVHSSLYNCLYCSYGSQELQPIRMHMANEHPNRLLYVCGMVFIKSLHPMATSVQGGSIDITSIKSTSLVHIGDLVNQKKFIITDGVTLNFDENSIEAVNSGQGAANLNARIRQMFGESALNFSDVESYMRKIAEGMQPDAIKSEETSELDQLVIAAVKDTGLTGKDLYRCGFPKCNQNFDSFTQFHRHIETHRGNKKEPIYRCPHCASIIALNQIRLHTVKHRRHRYICYFCAETSASQDLSMEHLKMEHQSQSNDFFYLTTDKDWTGQLSEEESRIFVAKPRHSTGDVTDTILNLLRKRYGGESNELPTSDEQKRPQSPIERKEETIIPVFVSKDNRFLCNLDKCTFVAKAADELELHLKERHPIMNSGQYSCAHCSYTVSSAQVKISRIGNHLCYHGPAIASCNICNYYHYNRANVLSHISACHPLNFVTMTLHNRSTTAIKTKIEILYNQHTRSAEDSYKCTLCDDQILTECEDFFIHMRGMHQLNVRFGCDLCAFFENSLKQVESHSKKCHPDSPPRIRSIFLPAGGKWIQNISQFELLIDYSEPNESEDVKEVSTAISNVEEDDTNRLPSPVQKLKTSSTAKETANEDDKSKRKRKHNERGKGGSKSESKKNKSDKPQSNSSNNDDKKKRQKIEEDSKRQSVDSSRPQPTRHPQPTPRLQPTPPPQPLTPTTNPKDQSTCQQQQPDSKELSTPSVPSSKEICRTVESILKATLLQSNPSENKEEKKFLSLVPIDRLMAKAASSNSETAVTPKVSFPVPAAVTTGQSSIFTATQQLQQRQYAASSCPSLVHQLERVSIPPPLPSIMSIGQQRMSSIPLINQLPTSSAQVQFYSKPVNQPITITNKEQLRGAVASYEQRPTVPIQQISITTMEQSREATMPPFQQSSAISISPIQHVPITTMEQSRGIMSFSHQQPASFSVSPITQNSVAHIQQLERFVMPPTQEVPRFEAASFQKSFQQADRMQMIAMQMTPMQMAPMQMTPMQMTPMQTTPMQMAPMQMTPMQMAPMQITPMQMTPMQMTPMQMTPMQMTPKQTIEQPQRMTLAAPATVQPPTGTSIATVEQPRLSPPQPAPINVVDRAIDDVYLSCFHCNGRQDNAIKLRGHFRNKHNGEGICFRIMKKLICAYCPHYASFADLKIHHFESHPNDTFISREARNHTRCAECPIQFKELEQLKDHTVHRHNDLPTAMYSSFSFLNQRYLEELLQLGESSMIFKCEDCEHLYIDSISFQDHMINFHKLTPILDNYQRVINRVIYGCNTCKVFFEAELTAVHHIQRHCARYGCNHCEMNFTSHNLLRNHYNLFHKITEESYQRRNSQESIKRLMEMLLRFKNGLILSKREAKFTDYGRHDEFIELIDRMEKAELQNWIEKEQRTERIESVARIKREIENEANLFQQPIASGSLLPY